MYLRKSRAEEQAGLSETLRRHREMLAEFAQRQGYTVDEVFEEVVSGESLYARPRMLELLERVEAGLYEAVLCMDIDRLGRGGMRDQGVILDAFKYSGTKIVTPERTYDLSDETDEELTEFRTFLSRREYKLINKRLQRGLRQTLEGGGYVASPPFGYRRAVRERRPTLAPDEEEAALVRLIFRLYVEEGLGTSAIAQALNAMGARPRRAQQFGRTSVGLILKNPVYAGRIVWDRRKSVRAGDGVRRAHLQPEENWLTAPGLHPPLVDGALFRRAQEIMAGRAHPSAHTGGQRNPMAGIVRCAVCGRALQRRGGGVPYLLCPTPGCVTGSRADWIEHALLEGLRGDLEMVRWTPGGGGARESALAAARQEEERLRAQRDRLCDLLERGVYDEETFRQRGEQLGERLARCAAARREWESRRAGEAGEGGTVYALYQESDAAGRGAILRAVLERVEYDKAKESGPLGFTLTLYLKPF